MWENKTDKHKSIFSFQLFQFHFHWGFQFRVTVYLEQVFLPENDYASIWLWNIIASYFIMEKNLTLRNKGRKYGHLISLNGRGTISALSSVTVWKESIHICLGRETSWMSNRESCLSNHLFRSWFVLATCTCLDSGVGQGLSETCKLLEL